MPKNSLRICYELTTIFWIREFVAKILNCSKLLSRIPDCSRIARTDYECNTIQLRASRTVYDSATNAQIHQFVAIRGIRGLCGIGA